VRVHSLCGPVLIVQYSSITLRQVEAIAMYTVRTRSRIQVRDSCYAEVGFNTIMYYVLGRQPSEKTNALLLRDRWTPGRYHLYRAIWRYV